MTNPWDPQTYDSSFGFVTAYGNELVDLLDAQPGERILDIGCGTGHHAGAWLAQGVAVVGIDTDDAMLAAARAAHPAGRFLHVDAQSFSLDDLTEKGPFDAAFSNAALHWMPRQAQVLANVRDALLPGGRFVAEMGGDRNIATVDAALRAALAGRDIPVPSNYFPTVAQQSVLLEQAGFRVELMRWFRRPTPLSPGETPATWTRQFRAAVWAALPETDHTEVVDRINASCSAAGLHSASGWVLDYCRLRFIARAE